MDRKSLIAIALCIVVLIAYPFLLKLTGLDRHTRPPTPPPAAVDTTRQAAAPEATAPPPAAPSGARVSSVAGGPQLAAGGVRAVAPALESVHRIETPLYRAEFTSRGARLVGVELKRYASAWGPGAKNGKAVRPRGEDEVPPGDRVRLAGGPSLALDLGSEATRVPLDDLVYTPAESLDASGAVRALTFTARDSAGMTVRQTWRVHPEDYTLDLEVELRDVPAAWRVTDYSITTRSWPNFTESDAHADAQSLRATSLVGSNLHRVPPGSLRKAPKRFEGSAVLASVQTRYFMGAVVATDATTRATVASAESRTLRPEERAHLGANAPPVQDVAINSLVAALPGETDPVDRYLVYFGPNDYFRLSKLGYGLDRIVDLGWSWIRPFSIALLRLMVWLFGLLPNYGVTIILLATLVRVLLHPLNMMSIRSMRAMQKLQPEMERIRAKYKNDPSAMNTAVMALYRENKVNPAGGCLPMLLQMPLFFALYSVLFNAIELRQQPFVGWIHDLSAPDKLFEVAGFPIRLLPVLMAGSGLLTQKLTPTDPRQATTMYLMNVVMVVFFYGLPSGLVLYWTVMNLLTALQQWLALRGDNEPVVVTPSPPARGAKVARKAATK
jgi:YidC/Oxa1 family membrane protein insertase